MAAGRNSAVCEVVRSEVVAMSPSNRAARLAPVTRWRRPPRAGVSSVTVSKHVPPQEDLFLDRSADAVELLRSAVHDPAPGGCRGPPPRGRLPP